MKVIGHDHNQVCIQITIKYASREQHKLASIEIL